VKILTVSDEECPFLWDYYVPGRLDGYDLILSCGDLSSKYLSFLVTMAKCPVLYVHGNHDTGYRNNPPEGCDCIDDALVVYNGVRILGLGGCRKYHPGAHQYTEKQMRRRIFRMMWQIRKLGGVDIVVTHAPPEGLGDDDDPAHWGFAAFREFLDRYHPAYFVHGHVHMTYGHNMPRVRDYNGTTLINAYERYTLELPDRDFPAKQRNELVVKVPSKFKIPDNTGLVLR
jgi:predicted phosphodiesterase